jgi:hypothetical protein
VATATPLDHTYAQGSQAVQKPKTQRKRKGQRERESSAPPLTSRLSIGRHPLVGWGASPDTRESRRGSNPVGNRLKYRQSLTGALFPPWKPASPWPDALRAETTGKTPPAYSPSISYRVDRLRLGDWCSCARILYLAGGSRRAGYGRRRAQPAR